MSLHAEIAENIVHAFGGHLITTPQLAHDAVTVELDCGVTLQARFADRDEYSIQWQSGERQFRIDTAPLHAGVGSFPNHFHDADGLVHADRLTRPGDAPWDNLRAVLEMIVAGCDQPA